MTAMYQTQLTEMIESFADNEAQREVARKWFNSLRQEWGDGDDLTGQLAGIFLRRDYVRQLALGRDGRGRNHMNAAVYARKSNDQNVAEEAKSVVRQIENARAFAARMSWTVDPSHIFVDDGISGAEFAKRPGLSRLRSLLDPRAPFARLIVSERKSIGREASETAWVIKQFAEAGVEIVEYVHGKSLTPRNAIDKVMSNVEGYADERQREATSERVREAHQRLHEKGHVVGGRVFGYYNRKIYNGEDRDGNPLFSHVERVINPAEAAIVKRIFTLYDQGYGLRRIAKLLTLEGGPEPKHYARKDGLARVVGWATSTVSCILKRETDRGIVIWNKTRKRNDWGKWAPTDRPESEWIRTPNEDLRLIDEQLWQRVVSRRNDTEGRVTRFESGRLSGRPPKHATNNLLVGLATCGICGGGLVVESGGHKRGRFPQYICHRHRTNGVCTNGVKVSVTEMNEAVLQAIEKHALTPEAIESVIQFSERDDVDDQRTLLDREAKDVAKRIDRITSAIAQGGEMVSLVGKLRDLEARQTAITKEKASLQPIPRLAPSVITTRLAEWRRLLRASTTQSRTVLQRVLRSRITFIPTSDGYEFTAPTRFDKLFTGLVAPTPSWLAAEKGNRHGLEHLGPEDTLDADYGRLLENAAVGRKYGTIGAPGGT